MSHGTFATVINCIDGRTQIPVNEFIRLNYQVDFVDTITEPGPDKILADNTDMVIIENIKKRVLVSTKKHGSKLLAIVAHADCAGNPIEKKEHLKHLAQSIGVLKSWNLENINIIALWVDDNWKVNKIE